MLFGVPTLSRPISESAVSATTSEYGLPVVPPIFLYVDPLDAGNMASRYDFRLCYLAHACLLI